MRSTNTTIRNTDPMIKDTSDVTENSEFSFFWDENLANSCCTCETCLRLQPTVTLLDHSTPTASFGIYEDENEQQDQDYASVGNFNNHLDDLIPAHESDEIYKPTITTVGPNDYSSLIRKINQQRKMRRAEEFLRKSILMGKQNQTDLVNSKRQSTLYCDIDAYDDETLWMLLQLSAKKLRGQIWPRRNNDDPSRRILIRNIAEKAFKHLFPPIKL